MGVTRTTPYVLRTRQGARAVFLVLFISGAPLAYSQEAPSVITRAPPEGNTVTKPADDNPTPPASPAPAKEEAPWIWVDLCIEQTQFCFSAVAAKPPKTEQDFWQAELTPENLAAANIERSKLKIHQEDGLDWVTLEGATFDENTLALTWALPLDDLEGQRLASDTPEIWDGVSQGTHPWTFALDYNLAYGNALSVVGDVAVGKKYTALLTNGSWTQDSGYVRGLTRLEHDMPKRNLRWSAGEIVAFSPDPLGASSLIRGVSVGRTFETSPTLITTARPNLSGVVDRSGTLEIYSNGQLISARPVRPGPYTLEQLGVGAGRQNITIVLRDEAGNRTTLMKTSYYGGSDLLAKGLTDFALRVGETQQGALDDTSSPLPSERLIQGYWRKGLTERLTVGVRADVGQTVRSYGVSAAVATPLGEVSGSAGSSSAGGNAYQARYSYTSNRFSFNASHFQRDKDYILPGEYDLFGDEERIMTSSGVGASMAIFSRMNISVNANEDTYYDGTQEKRTTVQVGGEIFKRAQWSLMAQRQERSATGKVDNSLSFMLSVPFENRRNATFFANQIEEGNGYGMSFNQGRMDEYGLSYSGNVQRSPEGITGGTARADYQTQHALYAIQADQFDSVRSVQGSVSGGVVWAAGNMFLTPPLGSGFAILRAPKAPDVPVVRENVPAGNTNAKGMALVRNLSPYYPSQIGFDPNQLPIDMSPGEALGKRIVPTVHTATLVEFNAAPVFAAQAKLMWPDNTAVNYGELVFGEPVNQSILIGKEGLLWIEHLDAGTYVGTLTTEKGTGRCTIEIKQQEQAIQDLGQIVCERLTQTPEPTAVPEAPDQGTQKTEDTPNTTTDDNSKETP